MESCPIIGAGIDLVENDRMDEVLRRWGAGFKNRVFLPSEQAYCETRAFPFRHYAGRFAVKEAVSKAFGTGMGTQLGWLDIEVVRNAATGEPTVRFSPKGEGLARERGVARVFISLSHTRNYAVAQALLAGTNGQPSPRNAPGRKTTGKRAKRRTARPRQH